MAEFTDEYFINLTMDYDKRDDSIYPQWAVWCAKSDDKYYIDGKDGHFFTHVRTDDEIKEEKRKRTILEMMSIERIENDIKEEDEETYRKYEEYLMELSMNKTEEKPLSYKKWVSKNNS